MIQNSQDDENSSSDPRLTWRGLDVPHLYFDITDQVELSGLDMLNYDSQLGDAKKLFEQSSPSALGQSKENYGKQPTVVDWVESDVDEQLMLFIPFRSAVGIQSIQFSSLPLSTSENDKDYSDDMAVTRPKQIKLYANQSYILDFESADDIPETQTIELEEKDWNSKTGTAQLQLRSVKFQRTHSLVMFIVSGEGTSDKVRLDRVRIIGSSGAKKEPGRLRRMDEDTDEPRLPILNLNEDFRSYNIEEQLHQMGSANSFNTVHTEPGATGLQAAEPAEIVTMAIDYAPGLDNDGFCRCCARVVQAWRDPYIVARTFNMEFSAPRFTTSKMQHHRSVASLKDCGENQKCALCKMIYSEIIYSEKEKLNRSRVPKDGITTSFFGHFVDGSSDELRDWSTVRKPLDQLPKGELVFSTSSGDVDAIHDSEVQIPLGGVRLSLTSGNPGARESPNLQIAVGHSNRCKLDVHPLKDSIGNILVECSNMDDPDTSSNASFKLASFWLDECRSNHKNCSRYQGEDPKLPSRVIDVGPSDGSEDPKLYVSGQDEAGRYLALSHRWGRSERLQDTQTKKHNYAGNSEAPCIARTISFSDLPLTFQHAITITRKFGYRYIWIDSLCIIQDDSSDWATESQKMADVYRRADFTVATIDAEGADSGCFFSRDGNSIRPCLVNIGRPPTDMDTYQQLPGRVFASPTARFDYSRASYRRHSSLDGRGWCLQERALSTRVLSYGKDGLYWECVTCDAMERIPEGIEPTSTSSNEYMRALKKEAAEITETDIDRLESLENAHCAWHLLSEDYSRRELSFDSDRPVALAGIVKNLSGVKNDSCYYGVWEKFLWRDLMWLIFTKDTILKSYMGRFGTVPPIGPSGRRLPSSIAPSWSWMSVRGNICYQASEYDSPEKFQIYSDLSFGVPVAGVNPHPAVVATGVLIQAQTCACDGTCDAQYAKRVEDDALHYNREGYIKHIFDPVSGRRVADWFPDMDDELPTTVYAIPIAGVVAEIQWLILVPVEDEKLNGLYYRRVGLAVSGWSKLSDYHPDETYRTHGNPKNIFKEESLGASSGGSSTSSLVRKIYIV